MQHYLIKDECQDAYDDDIIRDDYQDEPEVEKVHGFANHYSNEMLSTSPESKECELADLEEAEHFYQQPDKDYVKLVR